MDVLDVGQAKTEETQAKPSTTPGALTVSRAVPRAIELSGTAVRISLVVMVFFIPFRYRAVLLPRLFPPIYLDYTSFILYLPDIFLLSALLFWGLNLVLQPRKIHLGPLWLTGPLAGLTLVVGVSVIASLDRLLSIYNFIRLILLFGLYLLVLNHKHTFRLVSLAAGVELGVQAIIGITQVFQQHSLGLQVLQELTLDPSWKGVSIVWSSVGNSLRAYGLSDHPNILGGCLAIALILLILAYIQMEGRLKTLLLGLIVLGCTALFLTFSRSAWLGWMAGLALLVTALFLQRKKESLKDLLVLGVVCLLVMAPVLWKNANYLGIRLGGSQSFTSATPENQAIFERLLLDRLAFSIFQLHPLVGVGLSTFPIALSQLQPGYPFNLQPPHLVLLDVAAETGVFGGLFYLLIFTAPWALLVKNLRRIPISLELVGISAALLAISVISLLDYYPWMLEPGRLWLWLIWGLWAGAWMDAQRRRAGA